MRHLAILYPVFALAAWTLAVLVLVPLVRVRSVMRREIGPDDFKHGESPRVPGYVSIPNRNYMNLLELPLLFYVVCLLLVVTAGASDLAVALAWAYVALRVVHSLVQVLANHIQTRFALFFVSSLVLLALVVRAAMQVF